MRVCGNCGKESPDESVFCGSCGAPLQPGAMPPPAYGQVYQQPPKKKTPTWVWIVVALCACACICPIPAAILFPVFSQARVAAQKSVALTDGKQVALAAIMYAEDADSKFPVFSSGSDVALKIAPFMKSPALTVACESYLWNPAISGISEDAIVEPGAAWMFHGAKPIGGKYIVGYVDGHARAVSESELADLTSHPTEISKEKGDKPAKSGG